MNAAEVRSVSPDETSVHGEACSQNGAPASMSSVINDSMCESPASETPKIDSVICFSHLRWAFVYQRPQHLMAHAARHHRVWFIEEPIAFDGTSACLDIRKHSSGVRIVVPKLPQNCVQAESAIKDLLLTLFEGERLQASAIWLYTPMALDIARCIPHAALIYDCMDELSAFNGAPCGIAQNEAALMREADVVFAGGRSLFEAKRRAHPQVHLFPSSVDADHFGRARRRLEDPPEQARIARPRIGFFGVIDERFDGELLGAVAARCPWLQFVVVGPVVKIDEATLPKAPNIHYLGQVRYAELPSILANWDAAMMPFALNQATRFISPTKTPEYLAGGRAVVSTAIRDVITRYGASGVVHIVDPGDAANSFAAAAGAALAQFNDRPGLEQLADAALLGCSWATTWSNMLQLVRGAASLKKKGGALCEVARVPTVGNRTGAASEKIAGTKRFQPPAQVPAMKDRYDFLVVGAGFAGAVFAERLASQSGKRVLVVDRREHIGGNAYDEYNEAGILVHRYGPHIFHTNSERVVQYLSQFTRWRPYEHRVRAAVDGLLMPLPINLTTLSLLHGSALTEAQAHAFLQARAEPVVARRTAEDVVVSSVGRELYEKFFRGYTRKQWGVDPSRLDASVTSRIPTRTTNDDRYFTDSFQAMPAAGYTQMFSAMLRHPGITVQLGTDYRSVLASVDFGHMVFSGPMDEFFDYCYGPLPYRSLEFKHATFNRETFQKVGVVNYPNENVPFTRITEYKHLTGQRHPKTSITWEFPSDSGEPFYPLPTPEAQALFRRYQALAESTPGVTFVGRLGSYRYYNMDQVVAQSLSQHARMVEKERGSTPQSKDRVCSEADAYSSDYGRGADK
jgi:UDP-galactopyranose mutase